MLESDKKAILSRYILQKLILPFKLSSSGYSLLTRFETACCQGKHRMHSGSLAGHFISVQDVHLNNLEYIPALPSI